ncbi:hypothetical protein Baya_12143 [Bagarius yarrelli]|uniref:Uncharacterized protein n=1 Tax=Bagarius yarrelli TaxID=175774 RepID=A0A556V2U5_BAGYA|nr:hypothetical protein Baya_12143 [Bagarius yarrelli]
MRLQASLHQRESGHTSPTLFPILALYNRRRLTWCCRQLPIGCTQGGLMQVPPLQYRSNHTTETVTWRFLETLDNRLNSVIEEAQGGNQGIHLKETEPQVPLSRD